MKIVQIKNVELQGIVTCLKEGGLIIVPSDTVYGLIVDPTNRRAVEKLIAFKNRPPGKAVSIFVSDLKMLENEVDVNDRQKNLLNKLLPGPFTIVLESKHCVDKLLESERGTLGVRFPDYSFIVNLVRQYGKPLTATSANLSGRSPHYSIETLLKELPKNKKSLIDLVIDAGQLPRNKPSTIVDLSQEEVKVIRKGDLIFHKDDTFLSRSETQTKKIGQFLLNKYIHHIDLKPIVFILEGDLGTGKTVFVKGIGDAVGAKEIVSPTFVVSYEYKTRHKLVHLLAHYDLYNIQEEKEFQYLGIENYLKKYTVLCFEWGEKAGKLLEHFKEKGVVIYVKLKHVDESTREINYTIL